MGRKLDSYWTLRGRDPRANLRARGSLPTTGRLAAGGRRRRSRVAVGRRCRDADAGRRVDRVGPVAEEHDHVGARARSCRRIGERVRHRRASGVPVREVPDSRADRPVARHAERCRPLVLLQTAMRSRAVVHGLRRRLRRRSGRSRRRCGRRWSGRSRRRRRRTARDGDLRLGVRLGVGLHLQLDPLLDICLDRSARLAVIRDQQPLVQREHQLAVNRSRAVGRPGELATRAVPLGGHVGVRRRVDVNRHIDVGQRPDVEYRADDLRLRLRVPRRDCQVPAVRARLAPGHLDGRVGHAVDCYRVGKVAEPRRRGLAVRLNGRRLHRVRPGSRSRVALRATVHLLQRRRGLVPCADEVVLDRCVGSRRLLGADRRLGRTVCGGRAGRRSVGRVRHADRLAVLHLDMEPVLAGRGRIVGLQPDLREGVAEQGLRRAGLHRHGTEPHREQDRAEHHEDAHALFAHLAPPSARRCSSLPQCAFRGRHRAIALTRERRAETIIVTGSTLRSAES
jgi:hypothetical protein